MRRTLWYLKKYVTSHLPTSCSDLGHSKIFTSGNVEKRMDKFHLTVFIVPADGNVSCVHVST